MCAKVFVQHPNDVGFMSLNIPDLDLQLLTGLSECLGLLEGGGGSGWEGEGTSDERGQELQGGNALHTGPVWLTMASVGVKEKGKEYLFLGRENNPTFV